MRPVLLIALNYVREQRWALILLIAWVVFSAGLVSYERMAAEDALFFSKQQAIYGVALSAFLAASAIHNDRRSRRILTVLAKGICRAQYLGGLIVGLLIAIGIYCVVMGIFGCLMFTALRMPCSELWYLLALLFVASAVTAATAVLFASFLPPLLAIAATAVALGAGVASTEFGWPAVLPAFRLLNMITGYEFRPGWQPQWGSLGWSLAQSAALWLIASYIFSRRDIAVAVE
jgi:hypothetical protein